MDPRFQKSAYELSFLPYLEKAVRQNSLASRLTGLIQAPCFSIPDFPSEPILKGNKTIPLSLKHPTLVSAPFNGTQFYHHQVTEGERTASDGFFFFLLSVPSLSEEKDCKQNHYVTGGRGNPIFALFINQSRQTKTSQL